ncbi:MAG: hypothetical protein H7Y20_14020 [Bryobacteraceae bacterium]|nr:hypothetical protein [Bryobacteraceae bacterium]
MTIAKEMIAIAIEASVHELGGIAIDAKPESNHPYSHAVKLAVPDTSITGISNE